MQMNDKPGAEIDFGIAEIKHDIVSIVESSDRMALDVSTAIKAISALDARLGALRSATVALIIAVILAWVTLVWKAIW